MVCLERYGSQHHSAPPSPPWLGTRTQAIRAQKQGPCSQGGQTTGDRVESEKAQKQQQLANITPYAPLCDSLTGIAKSQGGLKDNSIIYRIYRSIILSFV